MSDVITVYGASTFCTTPTTFRVNDCGRGFCPSTINLEVGGTALGSGTLECCYLFLGSWTLTRITTPDDSCIWVYTIDNKYCTIGGYPIAEGTLTYTLECSWVEGSDDASVPAGYYWVLTMQYLIRGFPYLNIYATSPATATAHTCPVLGDYTVWSFAMTGLPANCDNSVGITVLTATLS